MTNKSTLKRERQILVARERNRIIKSKVHTAKRRVLEAMEENKRDVVGEKFNTFMSEVDKAVKRKVFHRNKGARLKSRLAHHIKKKFNEIQS
jgi:small subunit ribosomal protein S20